MEEWKTITDYDNYQISNLGNVKNKKTNKLLTPYINSSGYYGVQLCKNGKHKNFIIHRLIAIAFIPNPNNYPVIDHKDKNLLNNSLNNLRWVSISQNSYNKKVNCKTSKYRGVKWSKQNNKFIITIYINKKPKYIGLSNTEEEGALLFNNFVISNNLQEFIELNIL